MSAIDHQALEAWVGRVELREGFVTDELVARMRATLAASELPDGVAPLGIHCCLALNSVDAGEIGADGHPAHFAFRAIRPAFAGAPLWLQADANDDGLGLSTVDAGGEACMTAQARWG